MSADINREITWSPEAAARVVGQIRIIGGAFNELAHIVAEDLDAEEQKVVRHALGEMFGPLLSEILMPIERRFPELDCSLAQR